MFWRNLKISQKLFFGFGLVIILMLSVLGYSYLSFIKEGKAIDINLHTYKVIQEAYNLEKSLINMESGARGYAITGIEEFLKPFNQGKVDYEQHFNAIKESTKDNPQQQTRLANIHNNYQNWLEWENTNLIEGRRKVVSGQSKMEDLITVVQTGIGKNEMGSMLLLLRDIIKEEQVLLNIRSNELKKMESQTRLIMVLGGTNAAILAFFIGFWIIGVIVTPVKAVTNTFKEISQGDGDLEFRLKVNSKDELGHMSNYFNVFMTKLKDIIIENKNQSWLKAGQAEFTEKLRGEEDIETLAANAITYISKYMNAQIGALYVNTGDNTFKLLGSYAYKRRKNLSNEFKIGEGIVGQAALEKQSIIVTEVPDDYITITSGMGEAVPRNILVTPCIYKNELKCIIEIGSFQHFSDIQLEFVEQISEIIANSIHSEEVRNKTQKLLKKTLEQAEELQVQQEELRQSNEELTEQAKALRESEVRLSTQQEELRQSNEELEEQAKVLKESEARLLSQQEELKVINEELEERTKSLELQKNDIVIKNERLKNAQLEIEEKASALEVTSKYKSEFLANMSHELRTPLNSILVLSQMLANKKDTAPLTEKQLEFASTIHSSGQDLLRLINDILDLSKVEAGKMDINIEPVSLAELALYVERSFKPIAAQKGLDLTINIENGIPENVVSDNLRLQQVVNNLLSNAFKFTHKGGVTMIISRPNKDEVLDIDLDTEKSICISITDTGIGIPKDRQDVIFEAFKQSDGTTSRKYGGTGLGLSISKELACLLGGRIYLKSKEGKGSTFTLVIPEKHIGFEELEQVAVVKSDNNISGSNTILGNERLESKNILSLSKTLDEKKEINAKDKIILIIEDDKNFSKILSDLACDKGYKCICTENGSSGIQLAAKYKADAILLDIGLPDISGWKVIEKLKQDYKTKDIPVHIISGDESSMENNQLDKIVSFIKKPVSLESLNDIFDKIERVNSKPFKKLLILDKEKEYVRNISDILTSKNIQVTSFDKGEEAYDLLKKESFDCMILDLDLKDISGFELLSKLRDENIASIPILIHTEKSLSQEDEIELQKYAESIVIKGTRSVDRLVSEASLFLHDIDSKIEEKKIKAIRSSQEKESSLKNKKILIVDDDMRNVFALSGVLEDKGIKVVVGRNGKEGIQKLNQDSDIDLVLMDIMMPEMDGYTAMCEIRKESKFRNLPIIALTAKAMKDDRQKCIEAGANDYLTKPIDVEKLISLLRVWLYK